MTTLKLNYSNITQMKAYFKSLEDVPTLIFVQRRGLARLNEGLEKEFEAFTEEVRNIAEKYCERDENGNIITLENGAQKIKSDMIETANQELIEIYQTEIELDYMPFKLQAEYFDQLQCDKSTFELIEQNFIL